LSVEPKKVFIIGVPRSGTTWTLMLLAQHAAVVGFQQGGLFHALAGLDRWWSSKHGHGKRLVRREQEANQETHVGDIVTADEFDTLCKPLFEHVVHKIAAANPGTEAVVDQTPENLELATLILRLVPDAYFLHVIRDPRAVFCSLRSANSTWNRRFPSSPVEIGRIWSSYMEKAAALRAVTRRYHEVRYEDLLERGPQELARIFAWLGLATDAEFCEQAVRDCSIDKLRQAAVAPAGFFRRGEAAGWRDEATRGEIRCIEFLTGRQMRAVGYEPVSRRPDRRPLRVALRDVLESRIPSIVRHLRAPLSTIKRRGAALLRAI
jgi:hypothetical protein